MSYKSFEDYYHESMIKHILLYEYNGKLISPPFCTDNCKEYSRILVIDNSEVSFIDIDTPPATSKYNSMVTIGNSVYFAPYGIYDNFNLVLELRDNVPYYHTIDSSGKGQFYNMATDGETAFSSPLGYEAISFGLFINNGIIKQIMIPENHVVKRHMGTVYCNGNYYSPPRGESLDYNTILKFNPVTEEVTMIAVSDLPLSKRKYTDFIVVGKKLFALPFGRERELRHMLVLDTETDSTELVELTNIPHFMKKYNTGVLIDDTIIAMPYGHKDDGDANFGLIINTNTYEHSVFDIKHDFGGKYRFRSGIAHKGNAVFLPAGSPNVPIIVIDKKGNIKYNNMFNEYIIGRPIVYKDIIYSLAYHIVTGTHYLFTMDNDFKTEFISLGF